MGAGGRPSKISDKAIRQAIILAKKGFTDAEIAEVVEVDERTVNNWKEKHPQFFQSLKSAKDVADDEIEASLYKRAKGYRRRVQKLDKHGNPIEIEEELPPDPTSMIFWLKNRRRKEWRDKLEHELSGKDDAPLAAILNITIEK